MKTRSHRTPVSIWIAATLFSVLGLAPIVRLAASAPPEARASMFASLAFVVALLAYKAIVLVRLSRWPLLLLLHAASVTWGFVSSHLAHMDWRTRFPMLGPWVFWIPVILYFALTLPHWRKMNWAPFGRPYRPTTDQVEVFS